MAVNNVYDQLECLWKDLVIVDVTTPPAGIVYLFVDKIA